MANLSELRGRAEQVLADTSNAIWSTDWLDEGMRQALHEYSGVRPLQQVTTVTLGSDGRELDISAISGLLSVVEVWYPYTASDPEYPPNYRNVDLWRDLDTLYFPDGDEPQSGETARIFYKKMQTLNGLDDETTTSVPIEDQTLLVNGAAGHVAASRAMDLMEKVTLDRLTAQQIRAWGLSKLQEFRVGLKAVAKRQAAQGSAFVEMPPLDRYDRDGGGWC